jgi:ATP:corrinoid adenosyltransferase
MNIAKIVTDFIQSGEIQELANSQPEHKDAFITGATWAACMIAMKCVETEQKEDKE